MYYLKRLQQLGFYGLTQTLKYRLIKWSFVKRNRLQGLKITQVTSPWDQTTFYRDIIIPSRKDADLATIYPDIKTPWDLSRLHNLSVLGKAYQEIKDQAYVDVFQEQVITWIDQNPYLLGVNWVCTMEVAIRAINLISSIEYFRDASLISKSFWDKLTTSLHQHAEYINHNWEWSDKPNNHYLADLLGYLYLCFFFNDIPVYAKQQKKIIKKFLGQWQQQINPDGTSYEGSTAYHRLDTEMMSLFIDLCENNQVVLPVWIHEMYAGMLEFLVDCMDEAGNLVLIGDDDGGKVVGSLPAVAFGVGRVSKDLSGTKSTIKTYNDFGLTIIKKSGWHITFRHATFNQRQPSGHFNQDILSITVSIDGIPIFIDPGSYVYTANGAWRNYFRSWESHNTFYHQQDWRDLSKHDLFQLPRQERELKDGVTVCDEIAKVSDVYIDNFGTYSRELIFDQEQKKLTINDQVKLKQDGNVEWKFILHPAVTATQQDGGNVWLITHQGKNVAWFESSLVFVKVDAHYAPTYGTKVMTSALMATQFIIPGINQVTLQCGAGVHYPPDKDIHYRCHIIKCHDFHDACPR